MAKGSEFERSLCKQFSLWWTNNKRDDIFWRTSQSGGRATERKKKGKTTAGSYGDMMAIDEIGKPFENTFIMEFKKGYNKGLSALSAVDGKGKNLLYEWWLKNEQIVKESGRQHGLVVFKRDYKRTCIVISYELASELVELCGEISDTNIVDILFCSYNIRIVILPLSVFFTWCTPETISLFKERGTQ